MSDVAIVQVADMLRPPTGAMAGSATSATTGRARFTAYRIAHAERLSSEKAEPSKLTGDVVLR